MADLQTTSNPRQKSDVIVNDVNQNLPDYVGSTPNQSVNADAEAAVGASDTKNESVQKLPDLLAYPSGDVENAEDDDKKTTEQNMDSEASEKETLLPLSPPQNDSQTNSASPTMIDTAQNHVVSDTSLLADVLCNEKDDEMGDGGNQQSLVTKAASPSTCSPLLRVDHHEEDGEMKIEGEENRLLLPKSEMDDTHQIPNPDSSASSSRSDVGGKEDRGIVQKPLQRPVRTCAVLCGAFFFVYTANLAIQNLQSSLHQAAGLGVTSLAVLYGSIIFFGTLSPMVIRFLNAKRTLVLAFICHLLYTLSNFYSTFATLLTSSLLLGIMAGPMWTAQGLYCTATGMAYAGIKQMESHGALSLFNGVFFAFYEATQISGNLIASLVLMRGSYNETHTSTNRVCGAAVCPGTEMNSTQIEQPEKYIVYILMSIYLACNIVGLLLTVFALPPLPRDQEIQAGESSLKKSAMSCLSMLLVPKMVLLLPFFMAQAMNSGILLAEYNQKFVSCAAGIQWVGYVMTVFGVLTAAQAVGLNYAAKVLGRRVLFTAAAMADLSVNMTMLLWDPTGTSVGLLFILPCVSGFAEGIFQAQFNSLVAMVFPDQVTGAFATYHTSKATAFTITFGLARFLCLNQRLYVSLSLSALGLLGYFIVEVMLHRNKQRETATDNAPTLVSHISLDDRQS